MKTMSVEKHGYRNNVNTNSNGEVYKKNPQPGNLHNPKTHKKETPIKIVTVEKKGYPNNVNTQSNGKLNKEKLPQPKNTQRFIVAQNEHTPDALPQSKNLQLPVFAEKNDTEERLRENKQYERSIDNLISNFHTIVSKGPLYICTCCDQL